MAAKPTTPGNFQNHLSRRWAEGCTAGRDLLPEIKCLGYTGSLSHLERKRCYYPTPSNFSFFSGGRFVVWRAGGLRPDRWHNACEEQRRQAQSYHRRLPLSYPFRPLEHRA